jgi:hypothetical protein
LVGLGLKRGLEDDLVVAPYATALAIAPREAVRNLRALERGGWAAIIEITNRSTTRRGD